jgi:hypothetical protein
MAERFCQLHKAFQWELQAICIPEGLIHHFDIEAAGGHVQRTTRRHVITLQLGRFEAVEVHRTATTADSPCSSPLARLVPKGSAYGYDLIAYVGCETFLRHRTLESVALEFPRIPFSSLYDMQHKFLFYFGHLHRQSAPILAAWPQQRGGGTWLIDGTIEPGTPMYFGIYEAEDNILLDACRIPSENADAITPCLKQAAMRFGKPRRVLHDLSEAMAAACERAFEGVSHTVCNFHLLRDIGEDLYATPQARLRERLRQLKLQWRLKEQRRGQTEWLREHIENTTVLADVLAGKRAEVPQATAGREVLMAFHQWLLDYPRDGRRQGFPFDPYLLYFHRRVVRGSAAVERLLNNARVQAQAPLVLKNFASMLRQYLDDSTVIEAAGQYEATFTLFHRLRAVLRMAAQGDNPLHDRYLLDRSEAVGVEQSLESFREECRQRSEEETDEASRQRHQIVCEHLDRYWGHLFASADDPCRERTTNTLEALWGGIKRRCRQRQGRKKLTREFRSLPAEFMLISNLESPKYVEVVLDGELGKLAEKLAEAGTTAGPWTTWRSAQQPLNAGRLPQRLIRKDNFLDELTAVYDAHCQENAA